MSKSAEEILKKHLAYDVGEEKLNEVIESDVWLKKFLGATLAAMEFYATEQVKISLECMELAASQPEGREECKIGAFEHNKSIFHLGQCHSCYSKNTIEKPPLPPSKEQPEGVEEPDKFTMQSLKLGLLVDEARHYLMEVNQKETTVQEVVENTLDKLGFGKNGLQSNFSI